jgi:polygalacturonase
MMNNISDVVYIKSKERHSCRICGFLSDNIEIAMNHMIGEHGYRLQFIGTETDTGVGEMPFHYTVAILGK